MLSAFPFSFRSLYAAGPQHRQLLPHCNIRCGKAIPRKVKLCDEQSRYPLSHCLDNGSLCSCPRIDRIDLASRSLCPTRTLTNALLSAVPKRAISKAESSRHAFSAKGSDTFTGSTPLHPTGSGAIVAPSRRKLARISDHEDSASSPPPDTTDRQNRDSTTFRNRSDANHSHFYITNISSFVNH